MANKGMLTIASSPPAGRTTIKVDTTAPRQTILGFGAALTESAASVISGLPAATQQQVLNDYFGANGSGYTLSRTHIGSCDFALSEYNYDNTAGDMALANFSIANDQKYMIPIFKRAIAASGGVLKILASPWSAPGWMKDNGAMTGNGSDGSLLPADYGVYAKYLSKYITSYKAAGVPIWGITVQNEPLGVGGSREGMQWSDTQTNTFIRDNLGPQLQTDGVGTTQIFFYDHNKGATPGDAATMWATTILKDAKTNPLVAGTAVHWYDSTFQTYPAELDAIHAVDPTKAILYDEGTADNLGDTGDGTSSAGYQYSWMHDAFYWKKDDYDWGYWFASRTDHPVYEPVYRYARDIIVGLNHWYVGFIDWNAILNKDGGPGHVRNPCPAGILVDGSTPYYTPIFYTMQHFSKFFRPQAQVLTTTVTIAAGVPATDYDGTPTQDGNALIAAAAKNADMSVAVVLFNETNKPIDYAVLLGTQNVSSTIPAQSIQTIVWKP